MNDINTILQQYTAGEKDLEATNAALKEAGAGYHLDPGRNEITEENRRETVVGYYPEQANGWGLLDTGTGSPDKVYVRRGWLDRSVNEILPGGRTSMTAYVIICGKVYEVFESKLEKIREAEEKTAPPPAKADLSRRTDLAGQMVDQKTKTGTYRVTYDTQGYAIRSVKKEEN